MNKRRPTKNHAMQQAQILWCSTRATAPENLATSLALCEPMYASDPLLLNKEDEELRIIVGSSRTQGQS